MSNSGRGLKAGTSDPNATYTDAEVRAIVEGELRRLGMNLRYLHGEETAAVIAEARATAVKDGAPFTEATESGIREHG